MTPPHLLWVRMWCEWVKIMHGWIYKWFIIKQMTWGMLSLDHVVVVVWILHAIVIIYLLALYRYIQHREGVVLKHSLLHSTYSITTTQSVTSSSPLCLSNLCSFFPVAVYFKYSLLSFSQSNRVFLHGCFTLKVLLWLSGRIPFFSVRLSMCTLGARFSIADKRNRLVLKPFKKKK